MNPTYEKLMRCVAGVREKTNFVPRLSLVLGSGLGAFARSVDIECEIDYRDIQGFPVSTVAGHKGRFVFGHVRNVPVVIAQGRVHYYEGYKMEDVVLPVRLMGMLGAEILFLTNAAGAINRALKPGDFMIIKDHIMNLVPSPLIGENIAPLGTRFPDMSEVYNQDLKERLHDAGKNAGILLPEGVYIQLTGPNYETPAEVRMCERLGADAVGMSTACEAVAASHMGIKVCGISCISNMAAGISKTPLSHQEVEDITNKAAPLFKRLVCEAIVKLAE